MRAIFASLLWLSIMPAAAAADYKIIKLEQDVRNLERQVYTLQRQVDELRMRSRRDTGADLTTSESQASSTSERWLQIERWRRIDLGTSETAVLEALGPPTSMRKEAGARVLLYALEIGSSGFLSGSVTLEDSQVTAIEPPVLK